MSSRDTRFVSLWYSIKAVELKPGFHNSMPLSQAEIYEVV